MTEQPPEIPEEKTGIPEEIVNEAEAIQMPAPPLPATFGLIILLGVIYGITCYPSFLHPARWAVTIGSYYSPSVAFDNEWWRLITANLLHWNLMHLLSNAFGLWVFGRIVEPLLGTRNMVYLYIISGLTASLAMLAMDMAGIYWHSQGPAVAAGASGIDYGVMAAAFTFYLLIRRKTHPNSFGSDLRGLIILLIVYTYMNLTEAHVAIFAHLGGFLGGLFFALGYYGLLTSRNKA